jgi:hypothetical protein
MTEPERQYIDAEHNGNGMKGTLNIDNGLREVNPPIQKTTSSLTHGTRTSGNSSSRTWFQRI